MKQLFFVFILLASFLSANAAELDCLCFADTVTYSQGGVESIEESAHHHDEKGSEKSDHKDHCKHTCTQCHFAAVVPRQYHLKFVSEMVQVAFFTIHESPRAISLSLYRPPIA